MTTSSTWGKRLQDTLLQSLRAFQYAAPSGTCAREIILGVTSGGNCVGGMTLDAALASAGRILLDSGQVYHWNDTIVFDFGEAPNQSLVLLSAHGRAEPEAASLLGNLFGVGVQGEERTSESLPPTKLVSALLADEDLWRRLPVINTYAPRAVFDPDFNLCGPGWHPDHGILVHGPDIVPAQLPPVAAADVSSADRLPPYLKRLLGDFCFAGDADRENALALLLTGLLSNHFVDQPKPIGIIDGNQQEIGKTLLCQAIGQVLDGKEPDRIPLVKDDELEKKLGAMLRELISSVIFLDNIKAKLDSALIEANALSPILSVRLLGHSRNIKRPNTYLWLITSNLTSGSSDMITRGVPVRLRYEGNPVARIFHENLLEFAARHRLDILGELAGMVVRWRQAGMPSANDVWPAGRPKPQHRCQGWVQKIGGILGCSGFFSFLANVEEAKAAMDEGLEALATLAEHVFVNHMTGYFNPPASDRDAGKLPREWGVVFTAAGVCRDKLADKNAKGRDTFIGTFLSGKTDRAVAVNLPSGGGTAVLRRNKARNDQKRYFFEITTAPDSATAPPEGQPGGCQAQQEACQPASAGSQQTPPAAPCCGIQQEPTSTIGSAEASSPTTLTNLEWC